MLRTSQYWWEQIAGPTVTLNDPATVQPRFVAPDVTSDTVVTFRLTVADGWGGADTDTVNVLVLGSGDVPFVTEATLGTLRNNYSGWVGMKVLVGPDPVTVTALGRWVVEGNTGQHELKLVRASDKSDVAATVINLSGAAAGGFAYAPLLTPVELEAGTAYYVVSREYSGGDWWHDGNSRVRTTGVATATTAVWGSLSGSWNEVGGAGQCYVPVSFQYLIEPKTLTVSSTLDASGSVMVTVSPEDNEGLADGTTSFQRVYEPGTVVNLSVPSIVREEVFVKWQLDGADWDANPSTVVVMNRSHPLHAVYMPPVNDTAYVTGAALGTLRNNYGGWVGMKVVVGADPVTLTALGRWVVESNSGQHELKLVRASDKSDVAATVINLSGAAAGGFAYAPLLTPVELAAGTAYYVVSR